MSTTKSTIVLRKYKTTVIRLVLSTLLIAVINIEPANAHGRLIEPPSRASAWRYGFNTPANYNDHELFCGGFTKQHQTNKGKCGICGDDYSLPIPRPHEFGGKYGQGVIVRKYNPGSSFTIRVELTASHMGYFEFRVCDKVAADDECLDKHVLEVVSGAPSSPMPSDLKTRFYPRNGSRIYEIKAKLPADLQCSQCVLQWKYVAGNNWGICPDGSGQVGCGPQEEFRACSDVTIGKGTPSVIPTMKPVPTYRPTKKPHSEHYPTVPTTESTELSESATPESEQKPSGSNFMGALIAFFSFFLVVTGLVTIYIYHYHGLSIKHFIGKCVRRRDGNSPEDDGASTSSSSTSSVHIPEQPPVRPPRTKHLAQNIRTVAAEDSNILTGNIMSNKNSSYLPESA
jgi:hypothetical protein